MYGYSSSIESTDGQGPKVTVHGNHCALAPDIVGLSKLDATRGRLESTTDAASTKYYWP